MTDGLIEFLTARLNEREETARAATAGPWRIGKVECGSATVEGPDGEQDGGYDPATSGRRKVLRPVEVIPPDVDYGPVVELADAEHIVLNDPTYVLADIAAKRDILTAYQGALMQLDKNPDDTGQQTYVAAMSRAVQAICAPHVEHPDFQPEWRPWWLT